MLDFALQGEFNRMVQTMHAGNNMFPKAVGLAIQEYFEIAPEAAISGTPIHLDSANTLS
jgi:hypothetical protein